MHDISRRSFIGPAVGGLAALSSANNTDAQLVYQRSDWNIKEFEQLLKTPARVKQVYDIGAISSGRFLNNVKNSLNGLHFGFGIPVQQIHIVAALHGPANLLNYDDHVWAKYRIGEWQNVIDPLTSKPAVRNPFFPSKAGKELRYASQDHNSYDSLYQDTSIQGLQARGVKFLSCHTAAEEQARQLVQHWKLNQEPEDIVKEMLAHAWPGVLVVASMVASVAILQIDGHYSYITV